MFMMPLMGFISPLRDNSPTNMRPTRSCCNSCCESVRIDNAIGKSRPVLSLLISAGARLMVILLLVGKLNPEFRMAERIRSRLSAIGLLAIPIILKAGRP